MAVARLNSDEFIEAVQPLLERQDLPGLLHVLRSRWTCAQLESLVDTGTTDAKKVACLALSLVGERCSIDHLCRLLADEDQMVNRMAEHALWSIWFRLSTPDANHQLCRGAQALDRRDFDHAIRHFDKAIEIDPEFAEAYNQRALAYYFKEDFDASIHDCQEAIKRMPCHFGAWSDKGHCHAHLGQMRMALTAYRKALQINPHLECIRESVEELEARLGTGRA